MVAALGGLKTTAIEGGNENIHALPAFLIKPIFLLILDNQGLQQIQISHRKTEKRK